jgi:hypothetical protein
LTSGQLNLRIGTLLLVAGFALGLWLDPWSLGERDLHLLYPSGRMHARHGQAVVLADAFFQLGLALVLAVARAKSPIAALGAALSVCGSGSYVVGWTLGVVMPAALWLAPCGAICNLLAVMLIMAGTRHAAGLYLSQIALGVFALGMAINFAIALFAADPQHFLPAYLEGVDGVRMRMLRLARAAVIALPVLALLLRQFASRTAKRSALNRWGELLLIGGAIGMPVVLVLAATIDLRAKFLLGLPAQMVLAGVVIGLIIALRQREWRAASGWCLIAVSMSAGMLMGMYAFDGPLPAPDAIGQYNDFARRLTRLTHAYWIVQGMTAIFLAVGVTATRRASPRWRLAVLLLSLGIVATSFTVLLATVWEHVVYLLGIGALLSAASVACLLGRLTFQQERTPAPP